MLLSPRKNSEVFISSSSKLVFLTCPFRSAKLDFLVCVTLVFWLDLQKSFFLYFAPRKLLRDVPSGWKRDSFWQRASEEKVSSFFLAFSVSKKTTGLLFVLRSCALGTRIENVLDYVDRVLPKIFRFVTLCDFIGNIKVLHSFHTFFIKRYSDKFDAKSVLAWQSLILLEAASFCREEIFSGTKWDQTVQKKGQNLCENQFKSFVWLVNATFCLTKICRH